ncbi:hypothetical protein [Streptomyces sp. STCH 565 A]|uniref:hypothetical protein n=1 Tax=Streptomyces sp. STCH 565 A TaxID=2950532 RepID=UPI002074C291|nr:hypothetical protein [Streptomyces sp. STCH 565 A]MCM8555368.1 hypothetical protein [Streptomyces sp. STCH 565 A]
MDRAAVAVALVRAATAMENNPAVNPDEAVRIATLGHPQGHPGFGQPGTDLFDQVTGVLRAACHWPTARIDGIPQAQAITAAYAEAGRLTAP